MTWGELDKQNYNGNFSFPSVSECHLHLEGQGPREDIINLSLGGGPQETVPLEQSKPPGTREIGF